VFPSASDVDRVCCFHLEPGDPDSVSKAPPTIPAGYRKGDISVTGRSIQQ